jgi:methyltransferase (TIGR00027 family)
VTEGSEQGNGSPSITARRVAAYRLGFTRVPAPYGDAAADQALSADVAAGHEPAAGRMREYLDARTRFFDRVVVGAIGRGVRQVVVGAAGYDGRAFRYARSGVRWFEVDQPATQRDKRERLERLGIAVRHVRFVEADFTSDPVAERLTAAGLDPARPGLFLLEGVAVYLEPAVLERVLRQFRQVARSGSRLAISVSRSGTDAEARSRFQAAVAALGEPARSALEADEATGVLARTGWQVMSGEDADDPEAAARRARLRSAGLLTATAGPTTSSGPTTTTGPTTSRPCISREAVNWATGVLVRARLAVEKPDPAASRGKVARLTPAGRRAQRRYLELVGTVEDRWAQRFGGGTIGALRRLLEVLAVGADDQPPPLFQALEPYPDNWRALVRPPRTLPFYPMVLHRGGYPDGS